MQQPNIPVARSLQSGSPVIRSAAIVFDCENGQLRFRQLLDDRVGKARNPILVKVVLELPESVRGLPNLANGRFNSI
jgi:hypothetical protein